MAERNTIDISILREYISYCPDSGEFRWKKRAANCTHVGEIAGGTCQQGYHRIWFRGRFYMGHRIAFALQTGEWPSGEIDHINGNRGDNVWANLRDVDHTTNSRNQRLQYKRQGSRIGVTFSKRERKWKAHIGVNSGHIHLGTFNTQEDAAKAREAAELKFGFHANHGS